LHLNIKQDVYNQRTSMGKIELLCLGTGDAESALYENIAATSFALLLDGYPVLLVGAGPGSLRAVSHYAHLVPECILLFNASLEQVNEISALVLTETTARRHIRIFAPRDVCSFIAELLRLQLVGHDIPPECVSLISLPVGAAGGEVESYSLVHDFSVMLHPAATAPTTSQRGAPGACSALLCYRDHPLVAFSGPAPFEASLFSKLCQASFVVVWAAQQASARRASIYDIAAFSDKVNSTRRQEERVVFLVGGYGSPQDAPLLAGYVVLMHQGSPMVLMASDLVQSPYTALNLPLLHVRKSQPIKYPLNGKTTVLANDTVPVSNDVLGGGTYMHSSFSGGGAQLSSLRAGGAPGGSFHRTPLTAAALQQTSGGGILKGGVGSLDSVPVPTRGDRGGHQGGGPSNHVDVSAMERWMDPLHAPLPADGLQYSTHERPPNNGLAAYDTRKVYVFTNEDKGAPGKLLLLRNFRSAAQVAQRVAQMFSLKPIKDLHNVHGGVVRSLEELQDGAELIAVRRGGAPFHPGDLPRLLKTVRR
jgi:hypothetical protein